VAIDVHFDSEDWQRLKRDWTAWWTGELARPMVTIAGTDQEGDVALPEAPWFTSSLPLDMPAQQVIDLYQAHLERERFYADAWPRWWPNFGPGIIAGFVGAVVKTAPGTVWFEPAAANDLNELNLDFTRNNIWYRRVKELTQTALDCWGDSVQIALTDLGGGLDILASLRGTEQLLMDLCDQPNEVDRTAGKITALWCEYYDDFYEIIQPVQQSSASWAPLWAPGKHYMLQCDFSYMISPEMFERFVMPDLAASCEHLEYPFYHLDGTGQIPHLDMLLSLQRLRGIQWIPGEGAPAADQWLDLLKRIRDAGKLCEVFVSSAGARTIVRELGGRGFALHISDQMSQQQAGDFLETLSKENASGPW